MKKLIIILSLSLVFFGCCDTCPPSEHRVQYEKNQTIVIEIDGCEYILYSTPRPNGGVCIIHKANCKNHTQKKETESQTPINPK